MALPENKTPWPPEDQAGRYQRIKVYDAWWSGIPARLADVYGGAGTRTVTTGGPGTTINPTGSIVQRAVGRVAAAVSIWANGPAEGEPDARRHLPTARDIAVMSAELLFADPPSIVVDGPRYDKDGDQIDTDANGQPVYAWRAGDPKPETVAAQKRIDYLLDACGWEALSLEAAEMAAAYGSVGLRVAWDKERIADRPVIAKVDADAMWADYIWGQQDGVTFWRVAATVGDKVYRHLEEHQGGRIYHGLYEGTSDNLGLAIPLDTLPSTRGIVVDQDGALAFQMPTVADGSPRTAVSIANMLPDAHNRRSRAGASDYSEAVIDLLDAGDKLWTDMMLSADDAKSRIIIGSQLLTSAGVGKGVEFNMNQRLFQRVNLPPAEKESGGVPMEKVQFEMRLAEYWQGILDIIGKTLEAAGFTVDGAGGQDGAAAKTATEVVNDAKRSLLTRDKKIRLWADALSSLFTGLLAVDAVEFPASGKVALPVRVQFPEAVQPSMEQLANVAKTLKDAGLASLEWLVGYIHPDWDEGEVAAEVDRLDAEVAAQAVIDPITFGLGGAGVTPPADEAEAPAAP